ncbi:MAG: ABC-F family ATP-binding cassette domain-containing protein [Bacteroidales bacterium]|nr:ABC-F family ATP-binding cassette domain-containing protein [Bacteroidales bacterium]
MPSYLQIEHISKSYGPKVLFEDISFNVNEGDKIALIAPNGSGKTTLMRILSGKDYSDSGGKVLFLKDIRIAFLEQDYPFDPSLSIMDQILSDSREWTGHLDAMQKEEYRLRIIRHLTNFGLPDPGKAMGQLSGGEVKRVAITRLLAAEPDFMILDEPTNHLDIDAIEYLEDLLGRSRRTLLMVTHDRYFLDRVCNIVMDLDHGSVYTYRGDYENYLEKRQERIENYNAETDKVRNLLRRELEWMHATPCARSGKAKYRKEAFYRLQERSEAVYRTGTVDLGDMPTSVRLGRKVIDCKRLSFSFGDNYMVRDFSYSFQKGEKIGIVGPNGVGKSTFVRLLAGDIPDGGQVSGIIERGESLRIGYYRQEGMEFDEDQTVLETVSDTRLLGRFLFSHDMLDTRISKLSGGEKRRLYLLTILMKQPNLLILDEPTNDLDIVTMDVLEEYLGEYEGTLLMVSHDRHFLDRLAGHLLVFEGDGRIKDYVGPFSEYREWVKGRQKVVAAKPPKPEPVKQIRSDKANKLSFKEKRELEQLDKEIEALTAEKGEISRLLEGGTSDYGALQRASSRFVEIGKLLDEKEMRWLELSEKE